jgi:hypothetical protein
VARGESPCMRRWHFVVVGAVAVSVGLVQGGVGSAVGDSRHQSVRPWAFGVPQAAPPLLITHLRRARTFRVRAHGFTATMIDNPPANLSQGDEIVVQGDLSHLSGTPAGRLEAQETLTGLTENGEGRLELLFTAQLPHGQISCVAVLRIGQSGASNARAAVIGGTGYYRNARGQVYIHPAGQTTDLTFALSP